MENNQIPLKTGGAFNSIDFLQTEAGTLKELTVTITLAEYRDLVRQAATKDMLLANLGRDYAELSEKYGNAQKAMAELEKALMEEKNNSELYLKNNGHLRAEIERQKGIIADLEKRLVKEIKSQDFEKEAGNAEG